MITLEISKRQLFHLLLALRTYEKALLEDVEDPGPSQADAMLVAHLQKTLQEQYDKAELLY